jgi:hypothetical protein
MASYGSGLSFGWSCYVCRAKPNCRGELKVASSISRLEVISCLFGIFFEPREMLTFLTFCWLKRKKR